MDYYSNQITQLIEELGKLPGIGPEIRRKTGISHYQYATGSGAEIVRYDHFRKD